jgi:adenosylcobinamide-phosphate synthase
LLRAERPRGSTAARPLATLALAVVADACWGEPPARWHPVVAMGRAIAAAERHAPRSQPAAELVYGAAVALGGAVGWALGAHVLLAFVDRQASVLGTLAGALLLKSTFAVRALDDAAVAVGRALAAGDLATARQAVRALVSRDPAALDAPLVAAAAVESVAENLGDSFVGPLVWYAVLGVPGAVAYRWLNTCDAMWGYRGRYEWLGKAAARLDDAASWLPARLAAALLACAALLEGLDAAGAWRVLRRDRGRTASPNAGWPMSAAAGALGCRLEKPGHYVLGGDGRQPTAATIQAAVALARTASALAFGAYAAWAGLQAASWQDRRGEPRRAPAGAAANDYGAGVR